jgi:hypothetical protein
MFAFIVFSFLKHHMIASWIVGGILLSCSLFVAVSNFVALVRSLITHKFHSQVPLISPLFGIFGLVLIPWKMPHYLLYLLPILLDCGTIILFISLPRLFGDLFFNLDSVNIKRELRAFMEKKGFVIQDIEVCFLDYPNKDRKLVVNFLPSNDTFSHGIKAVERNVQMIIYFLVRRRFTRNVNWLQIAVNVECDGVCHVLVKYLCDETKIRELERHRSLFSQSIMKMQFGDIISQNLPHGVPITGFPEWGYRICNRTDEGIDVELLRIGESAARFSLRLCETEPVPVERLYDEVVCMEYEIQRKLNAATYTLSERSVTLSERSVVNDEMSNVCDVKEPDVYVLRQIRTCAAEVVGNTFLDWVLPRKNVMQLVDILKREQIRVLSVERFSKNVNNGSWEDDGVVWKTDDMRSPTKQRVDDSVAEVRSAMERESLSNGGDKAYHFVFDCRRLPSTCPIP